MISIPVCDLLTIIFVIVDDWYQQYGHRYLRGKVGSKPEFTDSEVITLVLAQDFLPFPGETQYHAYIRGNHLALFPRLIDRSQFNRRARSLRLLIEQLRRWWLIGLGIEGCTFFLLDSKPIPVVGVKRSNRHSDFASSAAYGYCASRKMMYYGYRLIALTTLQGLPVLYDLVPANATEREAADMLVDQVSGSDILADKGFINAPWQEQLLEERGNHIWTTKRTNQLQQNTYSLDRLIKRYRERIEGVFHELTDTGRNLERLHARTLVGLCTRLIAKVTSHLLKFILDFRYSIKVLTFSVQSISH